MLKNNTKILEIKNKSCTKLNKILKTFKDFEEKKNSNFFLESDNKKFINLKNPKNFLKCLKENKSTFLPKISKSQRNLKIKSNHNLVFNSVLGNNGILGNLSTKNKFANIDNGEDGFDELKNVSQVSNDSN